MSVDWRKKGVVTPVKNQVIHKITVLIYCITNVLSIGRVWQLLDLLYHRLFGVSPCHQDFSASNTGIKIGCC